MARTNLQACARPLTEAFDVALLDLDGVVYVGADAVRTAPQALAAARERGMRLAFVTNNAARPPGAVAAHLTRLGVPASADDVTTSAQAAAHYLADLLGPGSAVLVIGTTGLIEALEDRGLRAVLTDADDVAAVVQGYSPELSWKQLAEGAVAIGRGVPWVATNLDPTVPSPRGPLPGNGSLVAALRHATGVEPVATGKPDPTMHRESVLRSGAQHPLVVGDRLDTDIEGANAVGCASLLVLTGVTDARALLTAPDQLRPDFVAADLRGLLEPHDAPELVAGTARCGQWQAWRSDDGIVLERVDGGGRQGSDADGNPDATGGDEPGDRMGAAELDALRALCAAAWLPDAPGIDSRCRSGDDAARAALTRLGLD